MFRYLFSILYAITTNCAARSTLRPAPEDPDAGPQPETSWLYHGYSLYNWRLFSGPYDGTALIRHNILVALWNLDSNFE